MRELFPLVQKAVSRFNMLRGHEGVLVGFSGGPDSVFLVLALRELFPDIKLHLLHINHMIRPEAEAEEKWVKAWAEERSIPLVVERVDVPALARQKGVGLEEAGREARYRLYERWRGELGLDKVALGHTLTDSIETMFLNLVRGAGPRGLGGIPPVRGAIIRPLILVPKPEIEKALREAGVEFLRDPSNLDTSYRRNWIRHEVVGRLASEFPGLFDRLRGTYLAMRELVDFMDRLAGALEADARVWDGIYARHKLASAPKAVRAWLFSRMAGSRAGAEALERVLRVGGEAYLPGGRRAVVSGRVLAIDPKPLLRVGPLSIEGPGTYPLPGLGASLSVQIGEAEPGPWGYRVPLAVGFPFIVRSRRPGDRLGSKKLKKILIDAKIPVWVRDALPVLERGGRVLWVPGVAGARVPGKPPFIIFNLRWEDERLPYLIRGDSQEGGGDGPGDNPGLLGNRAPGGGGPQGSLRVHGGPNKEDGASPGG